MRLHTLLFTAAILMTASFAFAKNDKDKKPKEKDDFTELTEPTTTETSSGNTPFSWNTKTATITLFVASGWDDFFVCGYDKDGNIVKGTKTRIADSANLSTVTAAEALEGLDVSQTIKDNVIHFTESHNAYQLKVTFGDNVESIGLIGGNNDKEGHLVYSYNNVTTKEMFFSAIDKDGNVLYLGKDNWSASLKFNNGGVFMVEAGAFGTPLPTPVVTLLIALGFGAAFVMYRNRKQVKA